MKFTFLSLFLSLTLLSVAHSQSLEQQEINEYLQTHSIDVNQLQQIVQQRIERLLMLTPEEIEASLITPTQIMLPTYGKIPS